MICLDAVYLACERAQLVALAASEVIQHIGARAQVSLKELKEEVLPL